MNICHMVFPVFFTAKSLCSVFIFREVLIPPVISIPRISSTDSCVSP